MLLATKWLPRSKRWFASAAGLAHLARAKQTTKALKQTLLSAKDTGRGDLHYALSQRVFDFQEQQHHLYVGLDVSSRCTGMAVVEAKGKGVAHHACETHRLKNVIDVGRTIRTDVEKLLSRVQTELNRTNQKDAVQWYAGVEACAKSFTRGRFNAKGLVKLAQINGIAQYICAEQIGTLPLLVNPSTARTFYELRTPLPQKGGGEQEKEKEEGGTASTLANGTTATATSQAHRAQAVEEEQPVKERVFDFVQERETIWVPDMASKSRLDISDAFLIAYYTRVHHIFDTLVNDQMLWNEFDLSVADVKPASAKRDAIDVLHKYVWEWLRKHKHFLNL